MDQVWICYDSLSVPHPFWQSWRLASSWPRSPQTAQCDSHKEMKCSNWFCTESCREEKNLSSSPRNKSRLLARRSIDTNLLEIKVDAVLDKDIDNFPQANWMFAPKRMRRNKSTDCLIYYSICQLIWFVFMRLSFACFKSLSTCASDRFFKTLRSQIFCRAARSASLCASGSEVCCVLSALSSSPAASWLQTCRELCGPPFSGMKTIWHLWNMYFSSKMVFSWKFHGVLPTAMEPGVMGIASGGSQ